MRKELKIASRLVRLARLILSRKELETDDIITSRMRAYSRKLVSKVFESGWFEGNGAVKQNVTVKKFEIEPAEFLLDDEIESFSGNDSWPVTLIIMVTGDELTEDDKRKAKQAGANDEDIKMNLGNGGAITDRGDDNLLTIITTSKKPENIAFYGKKTIISLFMHEAMHVMDHIANRYEDDIRNYSIDENGGSDADYPGKPQEDGTYSPLEIDNLFDSRYTEYYTCRNELNELYSDMIDGLNEYIKETGKKPSHVLERLKECAKNKNKMKKFMMAIYNKLGTVDPLMSIYHMLFSTSKQRTPEEIKKIRERARQMIDRIRIIDKPDEK